MTDRYSIIDASTLPELSVVDVPDAEAIIAARMQEVKARWLEHDPPLGAAYDVETTEFDPIKIVMEANTSFEVNALSAINTAARATVLATAYGSDLDVIGSRYPGGVPRLPDEGDERYRRRLFLSANNYTTAGSGPAYEFQAMTAAPELRDVTATLTRASLKEDPVVTVTCLAEDPEAPVPPLESLLKVQARLADLDVIALTDVIAVTGPEVLTVPWVVDLWLYPNANGPTVLAAVEASLAKLREESRWLGSDVTRMAIASACAKQGVQNAIIVSPPVDVPVSDRQVAFVPTITVNLAGRTT